MGRGGLFQLGLLLGAVLFSLLAACAAPAQLSLPERLERAALRSMQRTHTPGAAIALIQDGAVVWTQRYGAADPASGRPLTADSLFNVASISKTAAAWGVMKLVETGRIDLDAPVDAYLTGWRLPVSDYDPAGVTIRRLLSHTAGLNTPEYLGYLPGAPLPRVEDVLSFGASPDARVITYGAGRTPPVILSRLPGEVFAYSDGGYLLLQLVIEAVTGQPFEIYMQQAVLDPLGMTGSSFTLTPEMEARMVISYDAQGNRLPQYRYVEKAPAGLYTTASELALLAAAASAGPNGEPSGRGVLRPETVAEMLIPQAEITGFDRLIYADGYSLGYYTETLDNGLDLVSHMGANLNGVTEFAAIPATGDGIVVLTTSMAGQEVFADVLAAWTDVLGYGAMTLPRAIRTARAAIFAAAALLAAAGLWLLGRALAYLSKRPVGSDPAPGEAAHGAETGQVLPPAAIATAGGMKVLVLLAPMLFVVIYVSRLHPYLQVAMPAAAPWLGLSLIWVCLTLVGWLLSRWFMAPEPPGSPPDLR